MGNETFYWDGLMNLPFTSAVKNTTQTQSSTNWNLTLKSEKFTIFKERHFGPPLLNFAHEITHQTFFFSITLYIFLVFCLCGLLSLTGLPWGSVILPVLFSSGGVNTGTASLKSMNEFDYMKDLFVPNQEQAPAWIFGNSSVRVGT